MILNISDFNAENIIEPLINFYKDFNYVNFILDSDFEIGYKLFMQMKQREILISEEKINDRWFQIYIKEPRELNFGEWLTQQKKTIETENMSHEDKDKEEQRILNKYR